MNSSPGASLRHSLAVRISNATLDYTRLLDIGELPIDDLPVPRRPCRLGTTCRVGATPCPSIHFRSRPAQIRGQVQMATHMPSGAPPPQSEPSIIIIGALISRVQTRAS